MDIVTKYWNIVTIYTQDKPIFYFLEMQIGLQNYSKCALNINIATSESIFVYSKLSYKYKNPETKNVKNLHVFRNKKKSSLCLIKYDKRGPVKDQPGSTRNQLPCSKQ